MNQRRILSILVIIFLISTILSVISLFYTVNKTTIAGKATSSQGTVSFSIEGEEEPSPEPTPSEGGGGPSQGGGREPTPSIKEEDLKFSEDRIKIITKINRPTTKELTISNPSALTYDIALEIDQLQNKITILENQFKLFPNNNKIITLNILSDEVGVETGNLIIKTQTQTYKIPIILETESENVLFDVSLDLKPKTLLPGEEINAQTVIFNVNEVGLVEVNLAYFMKDFNNNIILEDKETITLENQATTSKTFIVPENLKEGDYVMIVQVSYEDSLGTASELFVVGKIEKPTSIFLYLLITIVGIILIFIIMLIIQKRSIVKKIEKNDRMKESHIRQIIQEYLDKGYSKEEIQTELLEKGWPEDILENMPK